MSNFITADLGKEADSALQFLAEQSEDVFEDKYRWKWIIIALHNCVQAFMIMALEGSNGLNILRQEEIRRWLYAYEKGEKATNLTMASFLELYSRIKKEEYMKIYSHSKVFTPEGNQGWSIKKLNELRNDFMHFTPKGWLVEVSGMPKIALDCFGIIYFCGWESNNPLYTVLEEIDLEAFEKAKTNFEKLDKKYNESEG